MYSKGELVYVRAVTFHYVGRVQHLSFDHVTGRPKWLTLSDAAWIADTGTRLQKFVKEGIATTGDAKTEFERYPAGVCINAEAIVDWAPFPAPPKAWEAELKSGMRQPESQDDVFAEGKNVYVRAVTFHQIGKIKQVHADSYDLPYEIELEKAAWIADSGVRMEDFMSNGCNVRDGSGRTEFETYPRGLSVMTSAIVDIALWPHEVPFIGTDG